MKLKLSLPAAADQVERRLSARTFFGSVAMTAWN